MSSSTPVRFCGLAFALSLAVLAQSPYDTALKNLKFRSIGPATMGGRVDDFAVVESDPRIIYVGAAAGGVFKTVNGGQSWQAIFEDQANPSIGDLALAPSNPSILYVGTGEPNNRQSSSWGDGVYKSMDGGATFTHMGLKETHHIGRIVVHPTDPNIVYVAAQGDLWGPNKERGVYKSTDGGVTWTQVLFVNQDTGANDIAIDSEAPTSFTPPPTNAAARCSASTAADPAAGSIAPPMAATTGPNWAAQRWAAAFPPPATSAAAPSISTAKTPTSCTPWWHTRRRAAFTAPKTKASPGRA